MKKVAIGLMLIAVQGALWAMDKRTAVPVEQVDGAKLRKVEQHRSVEDLLELPQYRRDRYLLQMAQVANTTGLQNALQAGADVTATDDALRTPLHLVAMNGSLDALGIVLAAGAERCAVDSEGKTPLDLSIDRYPTIYWDRSSWRAEELEVPAMIDQLYVKGHDQFQFRLEDGTIVDLPPYFEVSQT